MNHVGGLVSADGTDLALKLKREPSRSNYTPQGIEIYKGKPILYSTGGFIDDYVVDPAERSNISFSFIVRLERNCIARIVLYPLRIEDLYVRLAHSCKERCTQ